MIKLTFEEAFEVMVNFHKVMEDVGKELYQDNSDYNVSHEGTRTLLVLDYLKFKTLKEMKEHICKKHNMNGEKEKRLMEVKISKSIKELIDKGLVDIQSSKEDRRIKEIFITNKGIKIIEYYRSKAKQKWEEVNK